MVDYFEFCSLNKRTGERAYNGYLLITPDGLYTNRNNDNGHHQLNTRGEPMEADVLDAVADAMADE